MQSSNTSAETPTPEAGSAPPLPARRTHPALWVPTLYFAEGLPMITVSVVAALMYKNLGVSNTDIAIYTGSLYLPWSRSRAWPCACTYRASWGSRWPFFG
jgi:PAT family beta-lactamase induction signal transducer AmpG